MVERTTYKPKQFNLSGLKGISDKTFQMPAQRGYFNCSVTLLRSSVVPSLKYNSCSALL